MALVLKYTVTEASDNTEFTLTDTTGVYDVTVNETGYGEPTMEYAEVETVVLAITPHDSVIVYTYEPDWTPTAEEPSVTVKGSDFTYTSGETVTPLVTEGSEIPDGSYTLTYTVNPTVASGLDPVETEATFLLYGQTNECIKNQMLANVCGCNPEAFAKISRLYTMLMACRYAMLTQSVDCAHNALQKIKRMCEKLCNNC